MAVPVQLNLLATVALWLSDTTYQRPPSSERFNFQQLRLWIRNYIYKMRRTESEVYDVTAITRYRLLRFCTAHQLHRKPDRRKTERVRGLLK